MAEFVRLPGIDLWDVPAQVRVIPVNTVGVMGRGLALQAKQRVPGLWTAYRKICSVGFDIGDIIQVPAQDVTYYLLPTKKDWRDRSQVDYIVRGLKALEAELLEIQYENGALFSSPNPKLAVSIPPLGSGCGNIGRGEGPRISPELVRSLIRSHLATVPNTLVFLY